MTQTLIDTVSQRSASDRAEALERYRALLLADESSTADELRDLMRSLGKAAGHLAADKAVVERAAALERRATKSSELEREYDGRLKALTDAQAVEQRRRDKADERLNQLDAEKVEAEHAWRLAKRARDDLAKLHREHSALFS